MDLEHWASEPHEGEWIYISRSASDLDSGDLKERIRRVIHANGWSVFESEAVENRQQQAALQLEALKTAHACLFNTSSATEAMDAELEVAVATGRPVIVLQSDGSREPESISALLETSELPTVIRYSDVDECLAALANTLGDTDWRKAVSRATANVA